jgi:O-methyltransferase
MDSTELYLDLLKGCLTRILFIDEELYAPPPSGWQGKAWEAFKRYTNHPDWQIVRPARANRKAREEGRGAARNAETAVGFLRLNNIQQCVTSVIEENIPGDLLEAGCQRGGSVIFMKGVLAAHGVSDRDVWLADTFEGLPSIADEDRRGAPPNPERYPADEGVKPKGGPRSVGVEGVKSNFARYGLLDDKVRFLAGLFKDTLPGASLGQLAVVRLDGDYYESTMDSITELYPKLAVGGYLIVDDYSTEKWGDRCGQAIRDYREANGITEPMQEVDHNAIYWRRER